MSLSEQAVIETRGVLFDMDGVLLSSIGSVVRCWRQWAKMYDIPDAENFEVPHGMRASDIIRHLRPDIDVAEGLKVIEDLEVEDMDDLVIFPGVARLLQSLPHDRWTIVTSATERLMVARLKKAGLPIPERFVVAETVEKGKPAPDPYIAGAKLLGLEPSDCIVVEDATAGVGAGLAAGSRVLAVLNTHGKDELDGATWHVQSLNDVHVDSYRNGVIQLNFLPA